MKDPWQRAEDADVYTYTGPNFQAVVFNTGDEHGQRTLPSIPPPTPFRRTTAGMLPATSSTPQSTATATSRTPRGPGSTPSTPSRATASR